MSSKTRLIITFAAKIRGIQQMQLQNHQKIEQSGGSDRQEQADGVAVYESDASRTVSYTHLDVYKRQVVGYLMQKEIDFLGNAVDNPKRPFVAILGGSKVSSKISVINNLLDKVDTLIIGGGMCYTFAKAQGEEIGKSLVEDDYLDYAKEMIDKAKEKGVKLLLPVDTVAAKEFSNDASFRVVEGSLAADEMGLDIGCLLYTSRCV